MKYFLSFFFISILLFSCSRKPEAIPSEIVSPDTMTRILTELHLAQSAIGVNAIADSQNYSMSDYQQYILSKYRIQKADFIKSVKYYTAHPELMKNIYDSVIVDLTRIQAEGK